MKYTDLVFDLYGTLVDIHTEESDEVWKKTALYFGYYGVRYTGPELKAAFEAALRSREAKAGQSYECYPDIPFEQIMAQLFQGAENAQTLGVHAAQLFRILSTQYVRLYPGVKDGLKLLREKGLRLWLLSNAQQVFTSCELRKLGLGEEFDGVYLSSDYGCRKPDGRFYQALIRERGLDPSRCLMIGNDRQTDIAGARAAGMATLYMHTALTPPDQAPADPTATAPHLEFEGDAWNVLAPALVDIALGNDIIPL